MLKKFSCVLLLWSLIVPLHASVRVVVRDQGLGHSVEGWVDYFSRRDRDRFSRHLENGRRYQNVVENILGQYHLPKELFFLGLIESGYNMGITSRARAVGPWQFMKSTARLYGLRVNSNVDERTDLVKATHAAARHLRDLRRQFGSWELALSAYNAGAGRVDRAIKRGGTRDYLVLFRRKLLPAETRQYLPKFLAASQIYRHPEHYGFASGSLGPDA